MSFWACARLEPRREALAAHFLRLNGFTVYLPRVRERRVLRGRRIEARPPLFPGYSFVAIVLQWHGARWCPGVYDLIMDGVAPARVPDGVIAEIRSRERGGLVELPSRLKRGDRVRVTHGPFTDHCGLYQGMRPRERVEVLLAILGGSQRVELPAADVEAAEAR